MPSRGLRLFAAGCAALSELASATAQGPVYAPPEVDKGACDEGQDEQVLEEHGDPCGEEALGDADAPSKLGGYADAYRV